MASKRKDDAAPDSARDRLLASATRLVESEGVDVSTRAICEDAGVTAPTLYHYFGDRDGLMQEVASTGFSHYLAAKRALESTGDPVEDLRRGWDDHGAWGIAHPEIYALVYGQVRPGQLTTAARESSDLLLGKLEVAARHGLLLVPPAIAERLISAANVGMTLALIRQPDAENQRLSDRLRDATLASVLNVAASTKDAPGWSAPVAAIALAAALAEEPGTAISEPELPLLRAWLDRLADPS
jgi:AcrR family transcriptional regulator